jgi:DNA helicase IV
VNYEQELAAEQSYFDYARDIRETRRLGLAAPVPAASSKDSAQITRSRRDRANQLRPPTEAPAFGRIDLNDGETFYVGYESIIDPETREPVVISWKAPVGELYSRAEATDPHGVTRKRSFECFEHKIVSFSDYVFADLAARIGALQDEPTYEDALLHELERSRTGEMHDVVKTIQAAQTPIMRAPLEGVLLVQGAPGTGKTVVALHRVSWLLYHYADQLTADQVLVVGPNPTFTRYIRGVLPALGDRDVRQSHVAELGPSVRVGDIESPEVTALKGREAMADLLARGLRYRVGLPTGTDPLTLRVGRLVIVFDTERLDDRLRTLTAGRPYMEGRRQFRTFLIQEIQRQASVPTSELPTDLLDNLLERIWPQHTAVSFLQGFLASRDRLLQAAGDDFTAAEVTSLIRRAAERLSDQTWSSADVFLLDELDGLLNGVPSDEQYGHIVVDEAQDLSPMQLRAIVRRAATGSMTVVGDIAQSTGPWARDSWDDVLVHLPTGSVRREELDLGYRVPKQVFDLAATLLPRIAPNLTPPRVVRDGPAEPDLQHVEPAHRTSSAVAAAMDHARHGRSVGVIAATDHRADIAAEFQSRDVGFVDVATGHLGGSINLVSPADVKGLEFDAVVLVEPEAIVAEQHGGLRMLYVAMTRTTKYLTIVHAGAALPRAEITPSQPEATRGGRRRAQASRPSQRPSRIVLAVAHELADQVTQNMRDDHWDVVVEALIDELNRRRQTTRAAMERARSGDSERPVSTSTS